MTNDLEGKKVLISDKFAYFGKEKNGIPPAATGLRDKIFGGYNRGHRVFDENNELFKPFKKVLEGLRYPLEEKYIYGEPIDWWWKKLRAPLSSDGGGRMAAA